MIWAVRKRPGQRRGGGPGLPAGARGVLTYGQALDVDYKQMLRWRKGDEPSGGAMHSLFLFASRLPGGLAILMGDGLQMTFFKD